MAHSFLANIIGKRVAGELFALAMCHDPDSNDYRAGAAVTRISDCRAAPISAPPADISRPEPTPCRWRADRPWRAEFPAMASGSADIDSRRFSQAPPDA